MPGPPDGPPRAASDVASRAAFAVWRGRLAGGLAAAIVGTLIVGALWVNAQWKAAFSPQCEVWEPTDMSIDDLITLKRRKVAWQASMDEDAALPMSETEVDFILRGMTDYELLAHFDGDVIDAKITVPVEHGCYNVKFRGHAEVDERVLSVHPEALIVGDLDLGGWVAGRDFSFSADDLDGYVDERVLKALRNSRHVAVSDSQVRIQLYDRRQMW